MVTIMESDLEKLLKICASRSRNKELKNKPTTGGNSSFKNLNNRNKNRFKYRNHVSIVSPLFNQLLTFCF